MATDESTIDADDSTVGNDDSPFHARAEYDATPGDVVLELLDIWVFTPARILWNDYRGRFGIILLSLYIAMGTVGTIVVPEPGIGQGDTLMQPFQSLEHPLGTDGLGQDMLGLMVHATPNMFRMIIAGAVFGGVLGIAIGLIAGYEGGTLDKVLMTITDSVGSIPGLPLLLILVALIDPSNPYLVGIILNIQGWTGAARGIRSQTLAIRKKEYVEVSEAMGESKSNILFKDALPELLPMIIFGFLGGATGIIHASVGLYFLGILPFDHLNWGVVLNHAYQQSGALYSLDAAHWLLIPAVVITGMTVAFVMLAQAFDQVFNPRVRARHEARKRNREDPELDDDGTVTSEDTTQVGIQ
ncbi:ABC transporter permease [Halobacteria archaeon AArc-m2/3/4]|uniref:ABC transporter permease n=1 Tax=Natronoglomus mannanivorans TaxID=2979990 RepID=A0AAP2Z2N2_9EURY|nr:ABC transporter permease [Halobacteria archaeon AArc-xg1-1]MCU4974065.1 ABC transporter permease [Halobacteria archaeon AArc-m2/3/4]